MTLDYIEKNKAMPAKKTFSHQRCCRVPFHWASPPLRIALLEPEIPPNTGNIARLCAATGAELHLIGQLGFRIDDASLRRAGLDYWHALKLFQHKQLNDFFACVPPERCHFLSTAGTTTHYDAAYSPGDALVFGNETQGLPDALLRQFPGRVRAIPIQGTLVRSLNLATAAGIVLYEALRQLNSDCPMD